MVDVAEVELVPEGFFDEVRKGNTHVLVFGLDGLGGAALARQAADVGGCESDIERDEVVAKRLGLLFAERGEAVVVMARAGLAVADEVETAH